MVPLHRQALEVCLRADFLCDKLDQVVFVDQFNLGFQDGIADVPHELVSNLVVEMDSI